MSRSEDDLLSPSEFAKLIGLSLGTLRKEINAGTITVEDHRSTGSTLPRYRIARSEATRWRNARRKRAERRLEPHKANVIKTKFGEVKEVIR